MADATQGIGSLPPTGAPTDGQLLTPENQAVFDQLRSQFSPEEMNQELLGAAEQVDPQAVAQFKAALQQYNLPEEILDALGQLVDMVLAEPDKYPELRAELIDAGVPEEILPAQFDPAYFGAMNMALDEMSAGMGAPQGFARGGMVGGMNPIAAGIASLGRNGDTMLAHITPSEARMLRRRGGSGTINPRTGLPEFFLGKVVKAVGGAFKSAAKAVTGAVKGVVGAVKSFAKSSVGKVVTAVALGFVLGPAAASFLGVSSAAGVAAISGFIGGAGSTLLAGGNLKDALRSGAIGGITAGLTTGVTQGFGAQYQGPTTVSGQIESVTKGLSPSTGAAAADDVAAAADDVAALKPGQVQGAEIPPSTATSPNPDGTFTVTKFDSLGRPISSTVEGTATTSVVPSPETTQWATSSPIGGRFPGAQQGVMSLPPGPQQSAMMNAPLPQGTGVQPTGEWGLTGEKLGKMVNAPSPEAFNPNIAEAYKLAPSPAPTLSERLSQGINTLTDTARSAYQGATDLYNQYLSPSQIQQRGVIDASVSAQKAVDSAVADAASRGVQLSQTAQNAIYQKAFDSATPGMLATYGPLAGAGLGAAYLMGGFTPQPAEKPEPPELGSDLFAQNKYQFMVPPGGVDTQYYGGVQGAQYGPTQMAKGGIADLPSNFPRKTGPINGPGTGTSDSIPAMLSDGEFVFTAKAVRNMGGGSRRLGAKRMYAMMKALEGRKA